MEKIKLEARGKGSMDKKIVMILVVCMLLAVGCGNLQTTLEESTNEYVDDYDEAIDVLNNKIPTAIFLRGEALAFRDGVNCEHITEITEETMKTDKGYTVLIVNDMDGTVSFTEEEIEYLRNRKSDYTFYFYYCGKENIDFLIQNKVFDDESFLDGNLCRALVTLEGDRTDYFGIYTEDMKAMDDKFGEKEGLQEVLLRNVVKCYKWNNM